jgi:hypothetical protein
MHDVREIGKKLFAQLDEARARVTRSREMFQQVVSDIPSGLPHPDGVTRINNAASEHRAAIMALQTAEERLDQFITTGKIPEELDW